MIQQTIVNGDTIIPGRNGAALVSSKSQPGSWHVVKAGQCDCLGYQRRTHCRHVDEVAQLATQPAPVVNATFALAERVLAGAFDGGCKVREESEWQVITAGEDVSYAEWSERRAH